MSETADTPTPDDAGLRTDVTDPDALREELIRLCEDLDEARDDPDAYDSAENRITQLLSDVRRARKRAYAGGDH